MLKNEKKSMSMSEYYKKIPSHQKTTKKKVYGHIYNIIQ